jgi:SAM-dependent methyltransferase
VSEVQRHAGGRPPKYTPDEQAQIIEDAFDALSGGKFLSVFCEENGYPYTLVAGWLLDNPAVSGQYARARAKGYTKRIEDMEGDAEKLVNMVSTGQLPDPSASIAAFRELRSTKQWNAERFARTLFAPKVEMELSGEVKTTPDPQSGILAKLAAFMPKDPTGDP